MRRLRGLGARIRDRVFSRRVDREMDEEILFHIEMETEKNVATGMDGAEARRQAWIAFGGSERTKERLREGRAVPLVDSLGEDLRFAWRSLRRARGPGLVAAFSIALGVGGTTTVFSLANGLLLQSPSVPAPEQMVRIEEVRSGQTSSGVEGERMPYPRYEAYERRTRSVFTALAAHRIEAFALRLPRETYSVTGTVVSGNYFEAAAIQPHLGRFFESDDDPALVLSHRIWRERFQSDPDVIGTTVYLDSRPFQVAGVAPESFLGLTPPLVSDVWVGAVAHRADARAGSMNSWVTLFGRLNPDVGRRQAAAAVETVGFGEPPLLEHTTVHRVRVDALRGVPSEGAFFVGGFLALLMGMALLVLLIASANIAGMLLARSVARRREVAIRLAMGAGRPRLIRHLMSEALILFAIGGAGGVAMAFWSAGAIGAIPLPLGLELGTDLTPDLRVLGFAMGLTVLTGTVFALVPALQASKLDLVPALRDGGRWSLSRSWSRDLFVGGQVAMSVFLLLVGGLLVRSLQRSLDMDLGFEHGDVALALTNLSPHGYDVARGIAFYDQLLDDTRQIPGVEAVGLSQFALLNGDRWGGDVRPDDQEGNADRRANAAYNAATPELFEAAGFELAAGRWISDEDTEGAPDVAVINETMAARLWPDQNPVGEIFRLGADPFEVIGVLEDGKYLFMLEGPTPYFYVSFAQAYRHAMTVHALAPGRTAAVHQAIREAVRRIDPNVAIEGSETHSEVVDFAVLPQRFAAVLVGVFGLIGLVLSAVGVYGVLSFQVAQRTREFGLRKALGASTGSVVGQVVRRGVTTAAIGCGVGWAFGVGAGQLLESFLVGLSPLDAPTFIGVPAGLLTVAALASLVPALRATSVEAIESLREE